MTRRKPRPREGPIRAADVGADGSRLFTRTQAARFLGITLPAVKHQEARGSLTAAVVRGVHVFPRAELDRYRNATQRGRVAAAAFALLREGHPVSELVLQLEVDPAFARELAEDFVMMSGAILCAAPRGQREAWERAYGVRLSPALVLRAVELAARNSALRARLVRESSA